MSWPGVATRTIDVTKKSVHETPIGLTLVRQPKKAPPQKEQTAPSKYNLTSNHLM
jgi:hypothetical protein